MKVIVVEFGNWHDECLYAPCLMFSKMGYEVVLAANSKLRGRVGEALSSITSEQHYFDFSTRLQDLTVLWRFRQFVIESGADALHINTAQGTLAWKFFLLPLPRRIKVSGVMHNIAKLRGSVGQKFITRRIDRYMLLSDLLIPAYQASGCKVPYVVDYAIFQAEGGVLDVSIQKPSDELWLVVPGAVNYHRRDYDALLELDLPAHVRIIILGNITKEDGLDFKARLEAMPADYQSHFVLFDKFVPNETFDAYMAQCDFLLPLVHTTRGGLGKYLTDKISGTYNLAVIHRKPMLCPQTLNGHGDMHDVALFYESEQAQSLSVMLKQELPDTSGLFRSPKWTIEYQLQQMRTAY